MQRSAPIQPTTSDNLPKFAEMLPNRTAPPQPARRKRYVSSSCYDLWDLHQRPVIEAVRPSLQILLEKFSDLIRTCEYVERMDCNRLHNPAPKLQIAAKIRAMYREALTGALMQVNFASSCLALMCIGRLEVRRAPLQLLVVLISFGSARACEVQRRSKLLATLSNYRLRAAVTWP